MRIADLHRPLLKRPPMNQQHWHHWECVRTPDSRTLFRLSKCSLNFNKISRWPVCTLRLRNCQSCPTVSVMSYMSPSSYQYVLVLTTMTPEYDYIFGNMPFYEAINWKWGDWGKPLSTMTFVLIKWGVCHRYVQKKDWELTQWEGGCIQV